MGERTKFVRENAKKHGIIGEKMTETERKFYQNSSKSWLSAVRSMETRGKKQLLPSNGNLYHYAGNNPVKYTDPDGKSEKEMLDEESKIPNFLQKIINNPENYEISVYQRAAIVRGNRGPIKVHSLYIIKDKETDTDYTLSFNGTVDFLPLSKGAWAINTPTDRAGYEEMLSGKNGYDMKLIVPNEVIDIKTTLNNIINSINSETKYYFMDHRSNMKNRENCNTALFNTLAISLPDYKLPRNIPQKPYFSFLLNTAPAFYQGR